MSNQLASAATKGDHITVKQLIDSGVNINEQDDDFQATALIWAAMNGHVECVNLLLDVDDVNLELKDDRKMTALTWAAKNGRVEAVKQLIDAGAQQKNEALLIAAKSGQNKVVRLLLDDVEGIDVNFVMDRWSVLMGAVYWEHEEIVMMLLEQGAKVDDGTLSVISVIKNKKIVEAVKERIAWSEDNHLLFPRKVREEVMTVMLMWNHDQYEEGECEGVRWNELPWEVVRKVIEELGRTNANEFKKSEK
eukprot:TRINITY_DN452_c0_g4_i1.p1 TRINITY_DN452_c0_g4~~TRINITY_DN452_c0_g4_i1.p1  ORF type:complete len:249 (+),score=91.94 TRINITY_DN452_c0_g4_i1:289-1035(+)